MVSIEEQIEGLSEEQRQALACLLAEGDKVSRRRVLCAYVVLQDGNEPSEKGLKQWVREQLPDYMVPDQILVLDAMPRLDNGKPDLKALPLLAPQKLLEDPVVTDEPRSDVEEQLIEIWRDLLGLEQISVNDNFFEIGGDSIISIQVVSRARQRRILLSPADITENTTIASLAAASQEIEKASDVLPKRQASADAAKQYIFRLDGVGNNMLYAEVFYEDPQTPQIKEPQIIAFDRQYTRETLMQQMATDYVEMVREVQPNGPYMFVSMDCGAHVTYEAAQQLKSEGESIAFMGVVEAAAPMKSSSVLSKQIRKAFRYLRDGDFMGFIAGLKLNLRRALKLKPAGSEDIASPFEHGLAINNYLPKPYEGSITIFQSTEYSSTPAGRDDLHNWTALASDQTHLRVVDAPYPLDILARENLVHLEHSLIKTRAEAS